MKLIDNGLDSLKKSIQTLKTIPGISNYSEKDAAMKDVILNLHHSIETLFKYIIMQNNLYLILKDVEKAFDNKFRTILENKPAKVENTIEFLDAVHRVYVLDCEKVSDKNKRLKIDKVINGLYEKLNYTRNALTHFEYEFDYDYEEHCIAVLLQSLILIYKRYIPNFDVFASGCGLYEDITALQNKGLYWFTKVSAALFLKIQNAKAKIEVLDKDPSLYQVLFNADQNLPANQKPIYSECPICGKKLFMKSANYIIDSEHIYEIGSCKCCNFVFTVEDAQLIELKYNGFSDMLLNLNAEKLFRLIRQQIDELGDRCYICTLDELKVLEGNITWVLSIILDNLCETVGSQYVWREITQYNDRAEAFYELDDFVPEEPDNENLEYNADETEDGLKESDSNKAEGVEGSENSIDIFTACNILNEALFGRHKEECRHQIVLFTKEIRKYGCPNEGIRHWENAIAILKYLDGIDTALAKRLKTTLSKREYLSYIQSMFNNWDGETVEFEIPVSVKLKVSEFQKLPIPKYE